jgi:hypothetical protein
VKLSVIIPFYNDGTQDGTHRQRLLDYLLPRWRRLVEGGVVHEVIVAADPLAGTIDFDQLTERHLFDKGAHEPRMPWSTARAIRAGMDKVTGDAVTCYGADHFPDGRVLADAVGLMRAGFEWTFLYQRVAYASEASTLQLLHNPARYALTDLEWAHTVHRCVGMWMWTRKAWEATGGVDPRFIGWGYGDDAWNVALESVFGPPPPTPGGTLHELWHPAGYRDASAANPNYHLFMTEYRDHAGDAAYFRDLPRKWGVSVPLT